MKQDGAPKKPKTTKKRVSDKPKTKTKTETSKKAKVSTSTTTPASVAAEQSAAKSNAVNAVTEQPAAAPVAANQTVAQPIAQPALPPQMAMGQRKSKAGLIIAICAAVLVVLLAIAGATAYAFYQKPENVLLDAVSKLPLATKVSTKTTVNSNFSYEADGVKIKFKRFTFDTGAENTPKFDANAELVLEVNGKELSLKASGLVTDNGTVYFKDNIVSSIKETLSILHQKLPAQAEKHLKKIDGKWVKYSLADARKQDKKSANQLQCVIDAYKKYSKDDKAKHQISSVYKKHPFIIIDKEVKSQNGNFGYDVSVDDDKAEAFWKDFRETSFAKSVESCAPNISSSSSDTYKSAKKAKSKADATMTVWVSQWSHELRGIDVKVTNLKTDSRSDKNYNVSAKTVIDFSKGSQVAVPSDAISAEEWARAISQSFQSVAAGSYLSAPAADADDDLEYGDYDD